MFARRYVLLLCGLLLLAPSVIAQEAAQKPAKKKDKPKAQWTSLFDGQTLSGWSQHSGEAKYTVEDGMIVGTSVPKTGNSFLCTDKTYSDFILEVEFQVDPELNSGVQFRSEFFPEEREISLGEGKTKKVPADRVHGYQCEIDLHPGNDRWWAAGVYDEMRRGWLFPGSHGGEGTKFTEQGRTVSKPGDWNKFRVVCRGDRIRTFLNGELRADFRDSMTSSGVIALQVHGVGNDESRVGKQVRWRNIRIRDLSAN